MHSELLTYEADGLTLQSRAVRRARRRPAARRAGVPGSVRARRACPRPGRAAGGDGLCRTGQRSAWRRPAGRRAGGGHRDAAAAFCRPVADTCPRRRRPRGAGGAAGGRCRPHRPRSASASAAPWRWSSPARGADIKAVVGFHSGLGDRGAQERRQGDQGQGPGLHRRRRPVHPARAAGGRSRPRCARPGSTGRCTSMAARCTASPTARPPSVNKPEAVRYSAEADARSWASMEQLFGETLGG